MTALRFSLITEQEILDLPREAGMFLLCLLASAWLHLAFFIAWETLAGGGLGLWGVDRLMTPPAPLEIVLTLAEEEVRPAAAETPPGELTVEEEAGVEEPTRAQALEITEAAEVEPPAPEPEAAEAGPPATLAEAEELNRALEVDQALAQARLRPEETASPPPPPPVTAEPEAPRFKSYNTTVRGAVADKWLVPPEARVNFHPGRLVVQCTIGRNGALLRFVVDESTGNAILDHAGLEALRSAAPFPPFPPELAVFSQLDITMIFDYQARYLTRSATPGP